MGCLLPELKGFNTVSRSFVAGMLCQQCYTEGFQNHTHTFENGEWGPNFLCKASSNDIIVKVLKITTEN